MKKHLSIIPFLFLSPLEGKDSVESKISQKQRLPVKIQTVVTNISNDLSDRDFYDTGLDGVDQNITPNEALYLDNSPYLESCPQIFEHRLPFFTKFYQKCVDGEDPSQVMVDMFDDYDNRRNLDHNNDKYIEACHPKFGGYAEALESWNCIDKTPTVELIISYNSDNRSEDTGISY